MDVRSISRAASIRRLGLDDTQLERPHSGMALAKTMASITASNITASLTRMAEAIPAARGSCAARVEGSTQPSGVRAPCGKSTLWISRWLPPFRS